MTLQTRVAILEKDVASLRSRMDNADVERDGITRQLADLHAETRGWAQLAVRADQKMDAAGELMQLIYADVRHMTETLAGHTETLAGHTETLAAQAETLAGHTETLAGHTETLAAQAETLAGHTETLAAQAETLAGHTEMLTAQAATLAEHGALLREILAKLDGRRP
jgi:methyl-accepting chemotaxis protein